MALNQFSEKPVLVVDDEPEVLESFELILNSGGFEQVICCGSSAQVMPMLDEGYPFQAVLLDLVMPRPTGAELLAQITQKHPGIPVIVVTATDELETAVECMKAGAFDYLVKPMEKMRLISSVRRAVERSELARENKALKERMLSATLEHPEAFAGIITRSQSMLSIFQYIEAIAVSPEPVLITGETGVGKELVARAVCSLSSRPKPFVGLNVAGLDDVNFSDTLFGHRRGAYTGADSAREGLIRKAAGGTLFLDEIGDLPPASQIKLLRLLQEHEYYPLGCDVPQKADVRIIAATNKELRSEDDKGSFRRDLYYRLQTHQIRIPPLRERLEDMPLLVEHFLTRAAATLGKPKPSYPNELVTLLRCYHFPGNVRELETLVFDAVSKHKARMLSLDTFRARVQECTGERARSSCEDLSAFLREQRMPPTLKGAQSCLVREAMRRARGNQSVACRLLGITQSSLSRRLKREE
ncbi:MAG: sigma-54-dependent Fis family transcriptional regulator [Desulfovibrionaceae bacterium]|jgi:DNA-binding NtrC family response regulator|nr:sigma-54-dependent Fis family transcriptional regulator [Desulfovibrionaceae bacterium]